MPKKLNIYFNSTIKRDREGIFKENYRFYLTENHSVYAKFKKNIKKYNKILEESNRKEDNNVINSENHNWKENSEYYNF